MDDDARATEHGTVYLKSGDGDAPPSAVRSAMMRRIKTKNTAPELEVRRAAHAAGLRFRLHRRDLPGTPDLIFPRLRTAVFVHGCFWHRHSCCPLTSSPKTRTLFWAAKFDANVARDAEKAQQLRVKGWDVLTIWECETRDPLRLASIIEMLSQQARQQATPVTEVSSGLGYGKVKGPVQLASGRMARP